METGRIKCMKIKDLDIETKRIITVAHIVCKFPTEKNIQRLREVCEDFDEKHVEERMENFFNFLQALDNEPCPYGGNHTLATCECDPLD